MAQDTHDPGTSAAAINPPFLSSSSAAKPEGASKNLKALVLGSIGVVFGDIGTSPLYTLQETYGGTHGLGTSHHLTSRFLAFEAGVKQRSIFEHVNSEKRRDGRCPG